MLVVYDYTTNAIFVEPISNVESKKIWNAYAKVFKYLESKGQTPMFNILDNQDSTAIKAFLEGNSSKYQFVEPQNHRVNAEERALQTFKVHFIAGLCTTDANFPTQLWDYLIQHAQDTLNLLRLARCKPDVSAYDYLEGQYIFDHVLMAPAGTHTVVYNAPEARESWAQHATGAWHLTPAKEHYRAARFYILETQATRISASA